MVNHDSTIFVVSDTDGAQYRFRSEYVRSLETKFSKVHVMCPRNSVEGDFVPRLIKEHKNFTELETSFWKQISAFSKIFRTEAPWGIHVFGHRMLIVVLLVNLLRLGAPLRKSKLIVTFPGLGKYFFNKDLKYKSISIVIWLFYFLNRNSFSCVFFLNKNDLHKLGKIFVCKKVVLSGEGLSEDFGVGTEFSQGNNVLFAGRLNSSKGIEDFLEAAKLFPDYNFLVAGIIPPSEGEEPWAHALRNGAGTNCRYLGFVEDIENLLRSVDYIFMPSRYGEGFPRIIIEGLACNCGIIVYPFPSSEDLIEAAPEVTQVITAPSLLPSAINFIDKSNLKPRDFFLRYFTSEIGNKRVIQNLEDL